MDAASKLGEGPRFVGTIECLSDGWRASFRLRVPGEVYTPQGDTEIFATELQATKGFMLKRASADVQRLR